MTHNAKNRAALDTDFLANILLKIVLGGAESYLAQLSRLARWSKYHVRACLRKCLNLQHPFASILSVVTAIVDCSLETAGCALTMRLAIASAENPLLSHSRTKP